jgi:hypothetical protein
MPQLPASSKFRLSVDTRAVIAALLAALLVRAGVLKVDSW